LQNDEFIEYAFTRSSEFRFATASIVSKTGVIPPPFWTSKWFAARCPASPSRVLAELMQGMTQGIFGIFSFD
jgi:hypothetical protein